MLQVKTLTVTGLFGHLLHTINIRTEERITVVTGPNASGKTHLLKILSGMVGLSFSELALLPFQTATVQFTDGRSLTVERPNDDGSELLVTGRRRIGDPYAGTLRPLDSDDDAAIPDYLDRIGPDLWVDLRDGEEISREVLNRRLSINSGFTRSQALKELPWLREFASRYKPTLIETRRLEVPIAPLRKRHRGPVRMSRLSVARRIAAYTERISDLITDARVASFSTSQRADRQFASRALDKARSTVKESVLRRRYDELSTRHNSLQSNGLTEEAPGVEFPAGRTNPTERRILNVFLDDWQAKLAPLLPVHEKLELWRSVIGEKLPDKIIAIDGNGRIGFRSKASGKVITVEMLSSGEQHLLALYTMLLFVADRGSLVLIDEPEISLHAAWKHAFLEDIFRIAATNDLQVVVATHSTAVINGRWELVEELNLSPQDD